MFPLFDGLLLPCFSLGCLPQMAHRSQRQSPCLVSGYIVWPSCEVTGLKQRLGEGFPKIRRPRVPIFTPAQLPSQIWHLTFLGGQIKGLARPSNWHPELIRLISCHDCLIWKICRWALGSLQKMVVVVGTLHLKFLISEAIGSWEWIYPHCVLEWSECWLSCQVIRYWDLCFDYSSMQQ